MHGSIASWECASKHTMEKRGLLETPSTDWQCAGSEPSDTPAYMQDCGMCVRSNTTLGTDLQWGFKDDEPAVCWKPTWLATDCDENDGGCNRYFFDVTNYSGGVRMTIKELCTVCVKGCSRK